MQSFTAFPRFLLSKYILKCLPFLLSLFLLVKKIYICTYTHIYPHMTKPNARHLPHFPKWRKIIGKIDFEISRFEI